MFAYGLKGSTDELATSHVIHEREFRFAGVLLDRTEALWLGAVGALVLVWLVISTLALGKGANTAPTCSVHGRAALACREDPVSFTAPANLVFASFGRGGRVCPSRP
jgi:hypothetical protein